MRPLVGWLRKLVAG